MTETPFGSSAGSAGATQRGEVRKGGGAPIRVGCVRVPHFAAAAALREQPDLRHGPVAIAAGIAPARAIVDATDEAWEAGVRPEMPEAEAVARCPGLRVLAASAERDRAAQEALLDVALGTSPRVEDGGPGLVYVDVDGLRGLYGAEPALGERLARQAARIGLPARVGIAGSRAAALSAARLGSRVSVVPAGEEARRLAPAPLSLLALDPELGQVFARWGVRTLGDLADLPRAGLVARLGDAGLAAQDLARGLDPRPFRPYTPPPFYQEVQGLEWEITTLEALEAVARPLLERLAARLDVAHVAADQLTLSLGLADGGRHERVVDLAYPMGEVATMLALLRLDLEAHPPRAAVVHVALSARPVCVRAGQGGFWRAAEPAARELTVVLARLAALVGSDRLGSPAPADSHRPDAFALAPFRHPVDRDSDREVEESRTDVAGGRGPGFEPSDGGETGWRARREARPESNSPGARTLMNKSLALRRFRPPLPAEVDTVGERPVAVAAGSIAGRVLAGAGPWRVSGEWWREEAWARDEWDLALSDGTLCRLVRDHVARQWRLDGVYD